MKEEKVEAFEMEVHYDALELVEAFLLFKILFIV